MPPRDRTKRRVIPTQERAQASAEAILTAAEQLLREHGFTRMTTNRIATRAGVNVALVYRYFAGKEAIVAALIQRTSNATREEFERVLAVHADAPIRVVIRALLEVLVSTPGVPELHRELFEQIDATKQRAHVRALCSAMTQAVAAVLVGRGAELRALPNPEATLFVLEHAVFAATHAAVFYRPADLSRESVVEALTDILARALLPVTDGASAILDKAAPAR
jgi:AcrR family transcriptional regulator